MKITQIKELLALLEFIILGLIKNQRKDIVLVKMKFIVRLVVLFEELFLHFSEMICKSVKPLIQNFPCIKIATIQFAE